MIKNSRKRTGTAGPISFSSSSIKYSQTTIHHRRVGRRAAENAFDAGRGQAAPADAMQYPDIALAARQSAHDVGGPVRRIVVDEDDLPGDAGQRLIEALYDERNIVALV